MIVSPDTELFEKLQDLQSWEGGASRVGFLVKQFVSVLIPTKSVGVGAVTRNVCMIFGLESKKLASMIWWLQKSRQGKMVFCSKKW